MKTHKHHLFTALTALAALSFTGCTTEVMEPGAEIGQLELPLTSSSASGELFQLEATFDLVGPETINTVLNPAHPDWDADALVLSPRVGNYSLTISNWRLMQIFFDAAGQPTSSSWVSTATLLGGAVQNVTILNNQTTSAVYQFSVPGSGTITFARGTLNIDFTVAQGFPDGAACSTDTQCASHVCAAAGVCAAASCSDGVQNGAETSPDCGGGCACGGGGTPGMTCSATDAASCPAGSTCSINAAGFPQCDGGAGGTPGMTCTAAQAASCPAGSTCSINAAGFPQCDGGGGGTPGMTCSATDAASCPAGSTCTINAAGFPQCN